MTSAEALDANSSMANELALIKGISPVVLDVGCACGDLGVLLKSAKSAKVYGLEYSRESCEIANRTGCYIRIDQQDLERIEVSDYAGYVGFFDYIICGDVLEHLRETSHVLSVLKQYLKPTGRLIASIPNVAHMSIKANLLNNTFEYCPVGLLDETHVHLYSYKSIAAELSSVGLRVLNCRFTMQQKDGFQLHNPYERLPSYTLRVIFDDWHSYVCQYVMEIAPDNHPAPALAFLNEIALQLNEENAPQNIIDYRNHLRNIYLPRKGPTVDDCLRMLETSERRAVEAEHRAVEAEQNITAIKSGFCWRITLPLRISKRIFRAAMMWGVLIHSRIFRVIRRRRIINRMSGCELIVDHNLGGGSNDFRNKYIRDRVSDGIPVVLFHNVLLHGRNVGYVLRLYTKACHGEKTIRFESWDAVREMLDDVSIARIVYNDLVYNPSAINIIRWIGSSAARISLMIHDFYPVCQFYLMTTADGCFCRGENCDECIRCQPDRRHLFGRVMAAEDWRSLWSPIFSRADEIRIFSPFAAHILERFYPAASSRIVCKPHDMSYFQVQPVELNSGDGLKVGIVGSIYNVAKGTRIAMEYANALPDGERLPLIGTYAGDPGQKIQVSGRYNQKDLPKLLQQYGINVVFFPSVCPETFSYTVSELMMLNVPVIAFDVGAQGDKVRKYARGRIIPEQTAEAIQRTAQQLYDKVYGGR